MCVHEERADLLNIHTLHARVCESAQVLKGVLAQYSESHAGSGVVRVVEGGQGIVHSRLVQCRQITRAEHGKLAAGCSRVPVGERGQCPIVRASVVG